MLKTRKIKVYRVFEIVRRVSEIVRRVLEIVQLVSAFPKHKKYLGICLLTPLDIHIKREFGHDVKISMQNGKSPLQE